MTLSVHSLVSAGPQVTASLLVRPEGLARSGKDRTSTRAANRVLTGGPGAQWAPTTRGVPVPCPPGTLVRPVGRRCLSLLLAPGTAAPPGCGGTSRLERSPPGSRARGPDRRSRVGVGGWGRGLRSEGSPRCWACFVFVLHLPVTRWEGSQAPRPRPSTAEPRSCLCACCVGCPCLGEGERVRRQMWVNTPRGLGPCQALLFSLLS